MKSRTKLVLKIMHILAWIIFIGICIKTGAIGFSFFVSMAINPAAAHNLHMGLDLSALYAYGTGHYAGLVVLILLVSALKAFVFYLVVKIFMKINFMHPFSEPVSKLITGIAYMSLIIGVVTLIGNGYREWLQNRGVVFPDMQSYLGGWGEHVFFGAIIFMIAQVFKRGIEIQSENDLTI